MAAVGGAIRVTDSAGFCRFMGITQILISGNASILFSSSNGVDAEPANGDIDSVMACAAMPTSGTFAVSDFYVAYNMWLQLHDDNLFTGILGTGDIGESLVSAGGLDGVPVPYVITANNYNIEDMAAFLCVEVALGGEQ
jgi:hypothetical protein